MSTFVQSLPLIGVLMFLAVGLVWRPWLHYRRTGKSGFVLFQSVRAGQVFRDGVFVFVMVAAVAQAVVTLVRPDWLAGMTVPLPVAVRVGLGVVVTVGGIALMAAAQLNLGKSWRIGIDEGAAPGLVIGGLYRVSRNPIFLGMFASLAGLAILLPTAASVAMLVLAIGCVRAQVLEEEAYLLRTYGAEYRAFAGRVGRFVPGVGLLR
jgi:protein-S-isoprenylcysteine O-methyltransferase Ste14